LTITALAAAEPPEPSSSQRLLSLVPSIGTATDAEQELEVLIDRAQQVVAHGNRVMADLASMIADHHSRRRHLRVTAEECEQLLKDTGEQLVVELEEWLAGKQDES